MNHFETIEYLQRENSKQREVYHIQTEVGIMDHLADYTPILTGTIPNAIDTITSDIDTCCYWQD